MNFVLQTRILRWRGVIAFIALWVTLITFMAVARLFFVIFEPAFPILGFSNFIAIIRHGLPTDLTMSAYLMVLPGILIFLSRWLSARSIKLMGQLYFGILSALLSLSYVLDAVLFPYWNFRLDTTPFFYFFTSPSSALASMSAGQELIIVFAILILSTVLFLLFRWLWRYFISGPDDKISVPDICVVTILTGSLFLPIRGGFSEATMTPGRGFFCNDMLLNQATVNPMFSLAYSILHNDEPEGQFRFFPEEEAEAKFKQFLLKNTSDSIPQIHLKQPNPDIYFIILESFSAQLMPSLGGVPIAAGLDSIALSEGVLFTNFYAESFRTDRAIPSILSGYPGQPTTSLMRFTSKLGNIPSLPRILAQNGWQTRYYYGGDPDFTNMKAYLLASGFQRITGVDDFPQEQRISRWGVPDGYVFDRVLSEANGFDRNLPQFTVIQTSSSHEPFDVPSQRLENPRINAFAYADSCLVEFVEGLKTNGLWNNSLVVIVADHWGVYPEGLKDLKARHHIPLVLTGGALECAPGKIDVVASQSDIAPTVLGLLNMDASDFNFGKDIFTPTSPRYAKVSDRTWYGLIDSHGNLVAISTDNNLLLTDESDLTNSDEVKAFFQLLYTDLAKR